jgi:indolepyruvate decarboxylase
MGEATTVGQYLIQRLEQLGVKHVFGIPGDYVLRFYDVLEASPLEVVGMCSEAGAGFAADAYARVNGLGALCVTYCVGGLNTVNAVAGAYAEKSPVIVISGAPGLMERRRSPLLHHRVRDFNTQRRIFEQVTVAAVALEDPATAPAEIDAALTACVRQKRPVYIELPRDVVDRPCAAPGRLHAERPQSDPAALTEALQETAAMLRAAKRPAVLGGVEIHRYGLQEPFLRLVENLGLPVATNLLGKSIVSERHPQYVGVYEGAMGDEAARRVVERADCLLILGAFMTDIDLGIFTAKLDMARAVHALAERIAIKHHVYEGVDLRDYIEGLAKLRTAKRQKQPAPAPRKERPYASQRSRPITVRRLFARVDRALEEDTIVICDIGDSLFGAAGLTIHRRTEFISPSYYTSMGFAVPAAVGAQIRRRRLRPMVFVGDGAFQMTGHELSSVARHGLNPIVVVLNNKGYTTERFINEGPYNDIPNWAYHRWPEILGKGWGAEVRTEGDLEDALERARSEDDSFCILNVHLDPYDRSEALERLGKRLGAQVRKKQRREEARS